MTRILTLLFVIFSLPSLGGNGHLTYDTIRSGEGFSFTIFHSTVSPLVAEKINQLLQLSEVRILKGYEKEDLFEEIKPQSPTVLGYLRMEAEVLDNSDKVVSILVAESSCGATCYYWQNSYAFNAGNGEIIKLRDLFEDSLYPKFMKYTSDTLVKLAMPGLNRLQMDSESLQSKQECYEQIDDAPVIIWQNKIVRSLEGCLSKWEFSIFAEVVATDHAFDLKEFKNYLNAYGRSLFGISSEPIASFHSKSGAQLYSGTLGGAKVLFILHSQYGENMDAIYAYEKYGKAISLYGKVNGKEVSFKETDDNGNEIGYMNLKVIDQSIEGTWYNSDRSKSYPVRLSRK